MSRREAEVARLQGEFEQQRQREVSRGTSEAADHVSTGSRSRSRQRPAPRPAGHELQGHRHPPVVRQPMNPSAVGRRAPVDERPADPRPAMQGSRTATADIRQFQTVISHLATAVRSAVVACPTTVVSRTPVPQSMTVSHPTPTAPQSTTVSQSLASDTTSTPSPQTATVSDAQSIPRPQTVTVTATAVSRPVTQDTASDIPMDTVEGAVGPVSEQSASQVVAPSTADVMQIAIKSETKDPDMPALEEVSPTLDLEVTRVISAAQLEDTSTLTPAEVEVLRARQLEEHGEVLSPDMPPVQNTPDTSTSTSTGTSQEGQTKVKAVVSSQGQTKGKTTAPTSQKTRTAAKKSTGYHRAPPPLRTDLLKGLRGIDVRRTLDQIKLEVAELDALPTRLTQEQNDLRTLRLLQSWILGDHLKGVRINMLDEDAMEFIQSLPYLPPDLEGATGLSATTSTTNVSTSQGVDLGVDQDSSDSDMEVDHRSQESRTRRTKSGPRSCEFADCPGYSVRDARHFAANHLPWFVIAQTACWECGSNRVQVKQLHKHLLQSTQSKD